MHHNQCTLSLRIMGSNSYWTIACDDCGWQSIEHHHIINTANEWLQHLAHNKAGLFPEAN